MGHSPNHVAATAFSSSPRFACASKDTPAGFSLSSFYVRSVFRIYPLYFVVLALYVVLIVGLGHRIAHATRPPRSLPAD